MVAETAWRQLPSVQISSAGKSQYVEVRFTLSPCTKDIIFVVITGVVYTLDRVLLPNPPTILRLVKAKQEFSRFLQLLEFAQMSEEVGEYIGILLTSCHLLSSV